MAIGVNWKEVWADVWGPVWSNTPPVEVPDVVGETQAAGTATLEGDGFVVSVATAYSSTVAAGDIISQVPAAGSFATPGSTVTITVSLGEAPAPPQQTEATGGWVMASLYEKRLLERRRRKQELREAQEAVEELADPVVKEIAVLLQKQERVDEERDHLQRLKKLAVSHNSEALPPRVQEAMTKAAVQGTQSSLRALDRELKRMLEEEELAVMMLLIND